LGLIATALLARIRQGITAQYGKLAAAADNSEDIESAR
jgi:hypothetical protein